MTGSHGPYDPDFLDTSAIDAQLKMLRHPAKMSPMAWI
jgi:hypothetical protein